MKTTNYLYLEYRRTLKIFRKLQRRFDKRITNGTLGEITARKRYYLLRKIEKLREKLAALISRLKLAGLAGALGLASLAFDADAQSLPDKTPVYDRYLINESYNGDQRGASVAMNNDGDMVMVWKDKYDLKGKTISSEGTESSEFSILVGHFSELVISEQKVAMNEEGDFVVVWQQDTNPYGKTIQMQKFDGETLVGESIVMVEDINNGTSSQKLDVALESDGDVFVTYLDYYPNPENNYVKVTKVADDLSLTTEIVNASSVDTYDAFHPSMDLDENGDGVVVWEGGSELYGYSGYIQSIRYRAFQSDELANGVEGILVTGYVQNEDGHNMVRPDVEIDNDGDILLSYIHLDSYYNNETINVERFDMEGTEEGLDIIALSGYDNSGLTARIASDAMGSFAITYFDPSKKGEPWISRYNKLGSLVDDNNAFDNAFSNFSVTAPELAMNDKGDFVVAWSDNHDGIWGSFAQSDDNNGFGSFISKYVTLPDPVTTIDQIPVPDPEAQETHFYSKVSSDAEGDYVVVWVQEYQPEISYFSILAQRFEASGKKIGGEFEIRYNDDIDITALDVDMNDAGEFAVAWASEDGIFKRHYDADDNPSEIYVLSADQHNNPISIAIDDTGDFSVVTWEYYVDGENIIYVNRGLDESVWLEVNDYATDYGSLSAPDVAITTGRDFVVVWSDNSSLSTPGSMETHTSIHYRNFSDANTDWTGTPAVIANGPAASNDYYNPQISANHSNGDFVIAWEDDYDFAFVRTFLLSGVPILPLIAVSESHNDGPPNVSPQVDMDNDGNFAVLWSSPDVDYDYYGGRIKKYNQTGEIIAKETLALDDEKINSSLSVAIGHKNTIAVGEDDYTVYQSIVADPVDFEFTGIYEDIVNVQTTDSQSKPQIATHADGDYVVAWANYYVEARTASVRIYNAQGIPLTNDIIINDNPGSDYIAVTDVALNDAGDFMVTWIGYSEPNHVLYGQIMNLDGNVTQQDFEISPVDGSDIEYDVAVDENGDFVVLWSNDLYDNSDAKDYSEIYVRKYSAVTGEAFDEAVLLFDTNLLDENSSIMDLELAINADGDIGMAYMTSHYYGNLGNASIYQLKSYIRTFVNDLSAQQPEGILLTQDNDSRRYLVSAGDAINILADDNGDFVIGTFDEHKYGMTEDPLNTLFMHRFSQDEMAITGEPVSVVYESTFFQFDMSKGDNGDFVLVYGYSDVFTKRVNSDFNTIGEGYQLNQLDVSSSRAQVISPAPGKFVAVWEGNSIDGSNSGIASIDFYSYLPILTATPADPLLDEGSTVNVGLTASSVINHTALAPVTFNLTAMPVNGFLSIDGSQVADFEDIPLADIDLLTYNHDGGETTSDVFSLVLSNGTFDTDTYSFDITVNPVNDLPDLVTNDGLSLDEGSAMTLSGALLITDVDNTNDEVFYFVETAPSHGSIWNIDGGEVELGQNATFTQADIESGFIEYRHHGDEQFVDSFVFTFNDPEFTSTSQTFSIGINSINDAPTLPTNTGLVLDEGEMASIITDNLSASDPDHATDDVSFTLTTMPIYGEIQVDGNPLALGGSFTQADLEGNLVQYQHDATESSATDSFVFDLMDANDEGIEGISFEITVTPLNDSPIVGSAIEDQSATEGTAFMFTVPDDIFSDEETTSLTLTATQSDDSALPGWLSFDGTTFTGTPQHGDGDVAVKVTATDEGSLTIEDEFLIAVAPVNDAPVLDNSITDQNATEDQAFSFAVPSGTFSDEETTNLTYTATQGDDSALPGWLSFDGTTFTGTPLDGDGNVVVKVTATDEGSLTITDEFLITVAPVNDTPVLANSISDQNATEDQAFSFVVPEGTFSDEETTSLTLTTSLDDGSSLPDWLSFDGTTFTGTPLDGDGNVTVKVTATDEGDLAVSTEFTIIVTPVNENPTLSTAIEDQFPTEGITFIFSVPTDTFSDEETTNLILTATQYDDSDLPDWLSFDGTVFTGIPQHGDGDLSVKLVATDEGGLAVETLFNVFINPVNEAPIVAVPISEQNATEDILFSFDIPSGTFTDQETSNLILTASLSDDQELPVWLSFDGSGFSGTPLEGDGDVSVKVMAEDEEGLSVTTEFAITVTPVNENPDVSEAISDQSATEDQDFSFAVPAGTFSDEETTSLTLTATQGDDSALPVWLSFDGTTFTGTPLDGDGNVVVKVTATDEGSLTITDEFTITVTAVNDTPILANTISDQNAMEDQAFSFAISAGTFTDEETTSLVLTATQIDDTALPTWLSFDGTTFTGTPQNGDGDVTVKVTAEDEGGLTITDDFLITVTPVDDTNNAPVVEVPITNQIATEDEAFSYVVPVGTFSDVETTALILTAQQGDGSALPGWLTFNGATFSGTPLEGDSDLEIEVTATDDGIPALSVSTTFSISVNSVNDVPVVANGIPDELVVGYGAFTFSVPSDAFVDVDGNALGLTATMADENNSALPSFMSFNTTTNEFSGQALINFDEGVYTIRVTATEDTEDQFSVSTTFDLTIEAVLGSGEELSQEVGIYPNPASEKLVARLENETMGAFKVQVIDQSGKVLYSDGFNKQTQRHEYEMDISGLNTGLYILRLIHANTTLTFKVNKM